MNEFIEKLIGRLEELYARNDKTKKMAYEEKDWEKFDLFTHRCEGIYSAISIVNQLADEYNNGWIPCSERLPEKYKPVLVLLNNKEMCVFTLETDFEDNNIMYWEDWYGYHKKISETIAWQPLPAPYQPKGE